MFFQVVSDLNNHLTNFREQVRESIRHVSILQEPGVVRDFSWKTSTILDSTALHILELRLREIISAIEIDFTL